MERRQASVRRGGRRYDDARGALQVHAATLWRRRESNPRPKRFAQELHAVSQPTPRAELLIRFDPACRSCYGWFIMKVVTAETPLPIEEIRLMAAARFGDLVKAVIDVERRVMVVDAELHADEEAELLAVGSRQQDLWGINLYPDLPESEWLEFDFMINLRPSFGNRTRGVDDATTRDRIAALVTAFVRR